MTDSIKVRAIEKGFFDDSLRELDAEFDIPGDLDDAGNVKALGKWMERIDGMDKENISSMTVSGLRELAVSKGIDPDGMKKSELLDALQPDEESEDE